MRWLLKFCSLCSIASAVGFGYVIYTTVWATPLWFNGLLDRQALIALLEQPELFTQIGFADGDWLDFSSSQLGDYSLSGRSAQYMQLRKFRAEILQWDRTKLAKEDQISYDMLLWSYDRRLADEKYAWLGADGQLYPVNQAFGVQNFLPSFLLSARQIVSERDARNYVSRLRAMGPLLDLVRADVQRQAKLGVIAPDFIIDSSIAQMNALIAPAAEKNVLVGNLAINSTNIDLDQDARLALVKDAIAAVNDIVYPSYRRLIAEERVQRARASHDAGLWRLRGGSAYYIDQLRLLTSTDMTPGAIHEYGLSEVDRITAEMDATLKSLGLRDGSVGARMKKLMVEPQFLYPNTEDGRRRMLLRYRTILERMKAVLPKYFERVPAMELDVRRVPEFAENGSPGAYYDPPSLDGRRSGVFFANMRNLAETPMWAMPTLAYHEGIPGHHVQAAMAIEYSNLPLVRRIQFLPAYDEGWALYAEFLAGDMGVYKNDPYGELGRLQSELFRASRLVIDTGIHARHWSRERAIEYMESTTGMAHSEVVAEVDRDVVWPAQVCAYSIGLKVIRDLRAHAMAALGAGFDLKTFHAQILENGALPLWLLQREINAWASDLKRQRERPVTTFATFPKNHA